MSQQLDGKQCAVCHSYLFDDDDIVYCPVCGAPHHRDCYQTVGHCALESLHGTDRQYDPSATAPEVHEEPPVQVDDTTCRMCGEEISPDDQRCPHCGAPNFVRVGDQTVRFDFLGGIPADMDIGEGVTADEAKRFVLSNTNRYIPKFAAMTVGKKASWNWLAFLFPCGWFLSRKMYGSGAFVGAVTVASTLLTYPFLKAFNALNLSDVKNYMEMAQVVSENLPKIGIAALAFCLAGTFFNIVLRFVSAILGDYIYRGHTISAILKIKAESEDIETDLRRRGGVSLLALLIGFFAAEYLPTIIASFL